MHEGDECSWYSGIGLRRHRFIPVWFDTRENRRLIGRTMPGAYRRGRARNHVHVREQTVVSRGLFFFGSCFVGQTDTDGG